MQIISVTSKEINGSCICTVEIAEDRYVNKIKENSPASIGSGMNP